MDASSSNAVLHRRGRINDIQWLRAVAVLGVVIHHAQDNLFSWHPLWLARCLDRFDLWSGVDIFFAISGFVIARSLLPQLGACGRNLRVAVRRILAFWTARAFRLLPSAWLWLMLILLASAMLNRTGAFGSFHTNAMAGLAGVFQVANIRFADAFDRYNYGASFAYWSLSLEEQFYLILPILILGLRRWIVLLLIAVIVIQALLTRGLLLICLRTDALAWGVLLAWLSMRPGFSRWLPTQMGQHRNVPRLLGIIAIACIGMVSAAQAVPMGNRISIVAMLAAVLVWIAACNEDYLSGNNGIFRRFMLWCGSRSYAIYLIHVPVFFLVRELWFRWTGAQASGGILQIVTLTAAAALLISLFAEINYRVLERPLRSIGKRLSQRFGAATALAAASSTEVGSQSPCPN